jgi:hypothetical protein
MCLVCLRNNGIGHKKNILEKRGWTIKKLEFDFAPSICSQTVAKIDDENFSNMFRLFETVLDFNTNFASSRIFFEKNPNRLIAYILAYI